MLKRKISAVDFRPSTFDFHSHDQHGVAVGVEAVALARPPRRMRRASRSRSGEARHQHEQGRARQVEVGEHGTDAPKDEARRDEDVGPNLSGLDPTSTGAKAPSRARTVVVPTHTMRRSRPEAPFTAAAASWRTGTTRCACGAPPPSPPPPAGRCRAPRAGSGGRARPRILHPASRLVIEVEPRGGCGHRTRVGGIDRLVPVPIPWLGSRWSLDIRRERCLPHPLHPIEIEGRIEVHHPTPLVQSLLGNDVTAVLKLEPFAGPGPRRRPHQSLPPPTFTAVEQQQLEASAGGPVGENPGRITRVSFSRTMSPGPRYRGNHGRTGARVRH